MFIKTFSNEQFKKKCWKRSNRQLQKKTLQIIKTIKTQTLSTQNYTTPNEYQKSGQKCLGRRYGTISLSPGSWHKKNNKKTWKIIIKNNKVFHHL